MWPTTSEAVDKKDTTKTTQIRRSRSRSPIRHRQERHFEKESRKR